MVFQLCFERMQTPTRHIHVLRRRAGIKQCQLPAELRCVRWLDSRLAVSAVKILQPGMPETPDHLYSVLTRYTEVKESFDVSLNSRSQNPAVCSSHVPKNTACQPLPPSNSPQPSHFQRDNNPSNRADYSPRSASMVLRSALATRGSKGRQPAPNSER